MVRFIETESNGVKVMINLLQVIMIEPVTDSNQCIINFSSENLEDIVVDEHYDTLKRKIEEISKI
jgi:hypothetical protein